MRTTTFGIEFLIPKHRKLRLRSQSSMRTTTQKNISRNRKENKILIKVEMKIYVSEKKC